METTADTRWLDLALLDIPSDARQHTPEDLESLAQDMKLNGQLQEIIVTEQFPGSSARYVVVAGAGRTLAARKLGWDKIRCLVKETLSEFDRLHITFSENEEREDVSPIYQAGLLFRMLRSDDLSQEVLAQKLGKTQATISQYMAIWDLAESVKEIINRFIILKKAHILQICRLKTPKDQLEVAKRAVDGDWSVRQLKAKVDQKLGISPTKSAADPPILRPDTTPDPLAAIWASLGMQVKWKGGQWQLPPISANPATPMTALADWLDNLAKTLYGLAQAVDQDQKLNAQGPIPKVESPKSYENPPQERPLTKEEEQFGAQIAAMIPEAPEEFAQLEKEQRAARIPKDDKEEAEVESLIPKGPEAVYGWIYGQHSLMVQKLQGATWASLGIQDPKSYLKDQFDTMRVLREADQLA